MGLYVRRDLRISSDTLDLLHVASASFRLHIVPPYQIHSRRNAAFVSGGLRRPIHQLRKMKDSIIIE